MVLERLSWCVTCLNHATFPSFGSCIPVDHKGVDLALHPVVGLVLQVGDAEKFPQALGFEGLGPFFRVSKQGPCFTAREEDGGDKRLVELELLVKLMQLHLHCQILFSLAIAEAILMWTCAEQVPSLHRVAPRYFKLVTSSNFWAFMLISVPVLFVLVVVMILPFSVLTSISYAIALSTSLLVRS